MVSSRSKQFAAALETPTAALPLVLLTAAAYYATGRLELALAIPPGYATVIWPPAGIALSAIVLGGRRLWPGVLLGSFLVNVGVQFDAGSTTSVLASLGVPLVIAAAAVLQAITGAWLIRRFDAFPSAAVSLRSIVRLLAFGGCVASLTNATIANATLLALGRIGWGEAPRAWATWWGGDAIGVFVFAPLILGVFCAPAGERWRRAAPIAAATFGAFAITVVLVVMNIGALRRDLATGFGVLSRELGAMSRRPSRSAAMPSAVSPACSRACRAATSPISAMSPTASPRSGSAFRRSSGFRASKRRTAGLSRPR